MTHRTRPQVFLSYTWADEPAVDLIERALRARGVAVFRDKDLSLFDPITSHLARAIDESAVLLAFYSRRYPLRYACQWELTRAFLAALRHGDPRDRVLVANPEPNEGHIAPVELTDAVYSSWTGPRSTDELVDAVVAKLDATGGIPFGQPPYEGEPHARSTRPRRFVGRYLEQWAVHSSLHGGRLWLAHEPQGDSAVALTGPAGTGKSSVAEQYAFLFRDIYRGGVEWIDLASSSAEHAIGHFTAAVNRIAAARFDLDVTGLPPQQAIDTLADRFTAADEAVLWVVDDVPDTLGSDIDQLVLPSSRVHTVITAKNVSPQAKVRTLPISGLSAQEVEELFRTHWPLIDRAERRAISALTEKWGGHPVALLPLVQELRNAQGTGALDEVLQRDNGDSPVVADLARIVGGRSAHARAVLEFTSTLASAPFAGELLTEGLSPRLGGATPMLIAAALQELEEFSLLHRSDRAPGSRQSWQLHALVADAVRREADPEVLAVAAHRAAVVVSAALASPTSALDLQLHAFHISQNADVPIHLRLVLLRETALRHEERGDIPAAYNARTTALLLGSATTLVQDVLDAARLAVAAGDAEAALTHTADLIKRARSERDRHTEFRARFLAATAHDLLGDFAAANEMFHDHSLVVEQGSEPVWLPAEERVLVTLARVASLRVRGEYRVALSVLEELLPGIQRIQPVPDHRGPWPVALLERARLRLLTGQVVEARTDSAKLVSLFAAARVPRHHLARSAVTVLAEAELTTALPELRARHDAWDQAVKQARRALDESIEWYGPDNPLTLELHVLRGQALHKGSCSREALTVLGEAEQRIEQSLGRNHPLALRARQWRGLVMVTLMNWQDAVAIFSELMPRQVSVLGRGHPESQLTRFQLGVCLAKVNDLSGAKPLITESLRELRGQHGPWHQWTHMAKVGSLLIKMPSPVWKFFNVLEEATRKRQN